MKVNFKFFYEKVKDLFLQSWHLQKHQPQETSSWRTWSPDSNKTPSSFISFKPKHLFEVTRKSKLKQNDPQDEARLHLASFETQKNDALTSSYGYFLFEFCIINCKQNFKRYRNLNLVNLLIFP